MGDSGLPWQQTAWLATQLCAFLWCQAYLQESNALSACRHACLQHDGVWLPDKGCMLMLLPSKFCRRKVNAKALLAYRTWKWEVSMQRKLFVSGQYSRLTRQQCLIRLLRGESAIVWDTVRDVLRINLTCIIKTGHNTHSGV